MLGLCVQFNDTLIHEKSFATTEIRINHFNLKMYGIQQLLMQGFTVYLNLKQTN